MHLIGILEKFDKFDESGSNRQTKTNQSKTIAINASIFYCMHEHYLTYVGRALVFLVIRQSLFRQNISAERICQTFPLSKFPHIWYFIAYKSCKASKTSHCPFKQFVFTCSGLFLKHHIKDRDTLIEQSFFCITHQQINGSAI